MRRSLPPKMQMLLVFSLGVVILAGCAAQNLNLSTIEQATSTESGKLKHFEESSYTVYMLFDLIAVSPATVDEIMEEVNPNHKPVVNLKITSQANFLTVLVNLLNGGIVDRGVIVSLNRITVEGDIVE
jgi:hypothetical protein